MIYNSTTKHKQARTDAQQQHAHAGHVHRHAVAG
jgi:hypothetical protein